jgi:catechol 2,3-dioxygenase-like lactoylglutathione lyase family enzyme
MSGGAIDHLTLNVENLDRATAFYDAALAPLSLSVLVRLSSDDTGDCPVVAFGKDHPVFWVAGSQKTTPSQHMAFVAETREAVDNFHAAALSAGGDDHGAPGLRPRYDNDYYAAFVIDPEGHNIEAVCRAKEGAA